MIDNTRPIMSAEFIVVIVSDPFRASLTDETHVMNTFEMFNNHKNINCIITEVFINDTRLYGLPFYGINCRCFNIKAYHDDSTYEIWVNDFIAAAKKTINALNQPKSEVIITQFDGSLVKIVI